MKIYPKKLARDTAHDLLVHTPNIDAALRVCNNIINLTRYRRIRRHYMFVKITLLIKKYLYNGN